MSETVMIDSDGLADWHLDGEDDPDLRKRIRKAYVAWWEAAGYEVWDSPIYEWSQDKAAGMVSGPFHEPSFEELEAAANAAWNDAVGTTDVRFVDGKWVLVD